jgi:ribosomal protein S27E
VKENKNNKFLEVFNMFNQFQQQPFYGAPMQGGVQYGQLPVAKMTQVLTPQEIKELRSTSSAFDMRVDDIQFVRAKCTHKDNGKIALLDNADGSVTCSICGETFQLIDWDQNQILEATKMFTNILQSIKTYYLDIPESYVDQYFKMLPLIEKVPKFYETAIMNFKKYEQGNPLQQNSNMFGFNMLNALASPMYSNQYMGGAPMQQGFGGAPMGQMAPQGFAPQGYAPQPMAGFPTGGVAPMGGNPFGGYYVDPAQQAAQYNQAQQGFNPQAQQGFNPQAQQQCATPQQTQAQTGQQTTQQVTQTKVYNV